eukprot:CAMPEP_0175040108 /NCGR_PEP_ID=MMETSP0052_2-20121109/1049_1 /TAXON_ID=51329 ORGANISM="Polytomella parva, Strain SAG 63-3" /NCGR_SAMPLE_ID=MMETSP0052_2 /ASSEMBLY_ACC=CAM_ASM_000194 /LENGTH=49 /DNA_ID=CAMNT_0016302221 /DNA_START=365 /DNA_END=514 /DNA_ORIENTATION=-
MSVTNCPTEGYFPARAALALATANAFVLLASLLLSKALLSLMMLLMAPV